MNPNPDGGLNDNRLVSNGYHPKWARTPTWNTAHARKDTMFEKSGKYYADWRDRSGQRLRKAFTSKRAALLYEQEQKELAHPKQKARDSQSPKFSRLNCVGGSTTTQTMPRSPKRSSGLQVVSRRANSPARKSLK
jgi:hypothetical protein